MISCSQIKYLKLLRQRFYQLFNAVTAVHTNGSDDMHVSVVFLVLNRGYETSHLFSAVAAFSNRMKRRKMVCTLCLCSVSYRLCKLALSL